MLYFMKTYLLLNLFKQFLIKPISSIVNSVTMFGVFSIDKYVKPQAHILISKDGNILNISSSF